MFRLVSFGTLHPSMHKSPIGGPTRLDRIISWTPESASAAAGLTGNFGHEKSRALTARRQPFRAWWVEPNRLLAGDYPGALTADKAAAEVRLLLDADIDSIDLTTEHDGLPRQWDIYDPLGAHLLV